MKSNLIRGQTWKDAEGNLRVSWYGMKRMSGLRPYYLCLLWQIGEWTYLSLPELEHMTRNLIPQLETDKEVQDV